MTIRKFLNSVTIMICITALAVSGVIFSCTACARKENRYKLSDERLFGISNLDEIVDTIRDALKNRSSEIRISFSFKGDYMDDISPFVKELMELAQEETGEPDEGDYIRYQMGGYTFSYGHEAFSGGYRYAVVITPDYYSTANQELDTQSRVQEILKSFSLAQDAGEYEKIRAVYDYIAENVSYDIVHKKNQYHTLKSTAYGALINHSATCQGIAVTIYRLLKEMGVDCRVITGMADNGTGAEYHAWNIVYIDGLYYNLDATWEKVDEEEQFFLKCDEHFEGHERDSEFETDEFLSRYPKAEEDYLTEGRSR